MYDWPEVAAANDALWRAVCARLIAAGLAAPRVLDRSRDVDAVWHDPLLVLSQTCGYPFATRLHDAVRLVATPVYDVEGCNGPLYSSMLVVRRGEAIATLADIADGTGGRRVAFNARDSLSGFVALVAAMRDAGLAPDAVEWVETGGHRSSVCAVAEGGADLAAIDAVCWALAQRHEAEAAAELSVIGTTPLRQALPFITAGGRSDDEVAILRNVLADALASAETEAARQALGLCNVAVVPEADYMALAELGGPDAVRTKD